MFNSGEYASGEVFPKQVRKRRVQIAIKTLLILLLMSVCAMVMYCAMFVFSGQTSASLNGKQSVGPSSNELSRVSSSPLGQSAVNQAQAHLDLLKALQLNVETELVHHSEDLVSLSKSERGFHFIGELQLIFYNHSDMYVEVFDFAPKLRQGAQQTEAVNFVLNAAPQTQESDSEVQIHALVLPPMSKQSIKLTYGAEAKCVVRSFVVDWQYQARVREEALNFIFQQNETLKQQAREATRYHYQQSKIVTNFANLKPYREKWSDFCQFEI